MVTLQHGWSLNKEKHVRAAQTQQQQPAGGVGGGSERAALPGGVHLGFLLQRQPAAGGQPGRSQLGSEGSSHGSLEQHHFTCRTEPHRQHRQLHLHHASAQKSGRGSPTGGLIQLLGTFSGQLLHHEHEQRADLWLAAVEEGLVADLSFVTQVLQRSILSQAEHL